MTDDPETLRLYASIFEKPRRDPVSRELREAPRACRVAARALRFMADALERRAPEEP